MKCILNETSEEIKEGCLWGFQSLAFKSFAWAMTAYRLLHSGVRKKGNSYNNLWGEFSVSCYH